VADQKTARKRRESDDEAPKAPRKRREPEDEEEAQRTRRDPADGEEAPRTRRDPADEEEAPRKRREPEEEEEAPRKRREPEDGPRRLSGAQLAVHARRQLAEITGLHAEAVTSLERTGDGKWRVTVELLELSRLPETDDLLGSYEAELDEEGELIGYRRLRRYARSQSDEGG
jgi:hypothetical protein